MGNVLVAIPVKPFGVAKARLGRVLDAEQRSRLGIAVAEHTAAAAAKTGAPVAIVTGDPGVARWGRRHGHGVVNELEARGHGLDRAAAAAAAHAHRNDMRWAIVHADLPLVTSGDILVLLAAVESGPVMAPSRDGGTNVLGGSGDGFPFSYGLGSFTRHLAAAPAATVLSRPGLAFDLDTPEDLERIRRAPSAGWIDALLS